MSSASSSKKLHPPIARPPFLPPKRHKFTFIDLFAGVGGFRLAMQSLGGRCVFSSEWDKFAAQTYHANFGDLPYGDITLEETKKHIPRHFDVLCAGFPCQAFSIAGLRKGFADTRGTLFFHIEAIVERHRPKLVFLENVKNLLTHDKGRTFEVIHNILRDKLGYQVHYQVLNSMTHANIPQNRERLFIVAIDPKQVVGSENFLFPEEIPLTINIRQILDTEQQNEALYYNHHTYYPKLSEVMTRRDTIYQWRRIYVRENKNQVCPTLTANMGTGGHNVPLVLDDFGIRKLSPRECFRFQGYPDHYILPLSQAKSKLYMQAGNSVTVPLVERIARGFVALL